MLCTKVRYKSWKSLFSRTKNKGVGMLRSFMARKCDRSFTMEQKLRRFLTCGMTIYGVAPEKQQEVIDRVLKMDLKSVADQLLAQAMAQSQEEFQEAERKGKALEAARRG
mgnify:CR=1 FL=1